MGGALLAFVGPDAVDDLDGNALLYSLGTVAYQFLHTISFLGAVGLLAGSFIRAGFPRLSHCCLSATQGQISSK